MCIHRLHLCPDGQPVWLVVRGDDRVCMAWYSQHVCFLPKTWIVWLGVVCQPRLNCRWCCAVCSAYRLSAITQAARCVPDSRATGGSSAAHTGIALGHLVRNRQPDGGLTGLGMSPMIAGTSRTAW